MNTIRKIDNGTNRLAPALFAMGYTYESCENNPEAWKIHEKSMYRGINFVK